jgi:hypothetical protein
MVTFMVSPPFAFRLNIHHLSTSRQVKKFPATLLKGAGRLPDNVEGDTDERVPQVVLRRVFDWNGLGVDRQSLDRNGRLMGYQFSEPPLRPAARGVPTS